MKTVNLLLTFSEDFCGIYTFWRHWFYNTLKLQYVSTWVTVAMSHSGVFSPAFLLLSVYAQLLTAVRKNRLRKCELGVSVTSVA